ncbi:MAG: protein phosphatase 2C domain-containing protein [Paracoccaceae bacterium]|nr:protein phosphatase 2C domain-containing protein [Paracoccaceae bacterium]
MQEAPEFRFDAASVLSLGRRDHQEDALATDFPIGADFGFAVLADGMGGHAAGDVASKIVVTEVFSELMFQSSDVDAMTSDIGEVLRNAAYAANECVRAHTESNPETDGMGSTLLAPVISNGKLYWISVGDSPLLLFRDGKLEQLNEDHSMAPQIDLMVAAGALTEDAAANHPDRNALTSVLFGDEIEAIDCRDDPFLLADGDVLIAASDGLQFLDDREIVAILKGNLAKPAATIARQLLDALENLDDPAQDNVSFAVIKVQTMVVDALSQLAAELVRASSDNSVDEPAAESLEDPEPVEYTPAKLAVRAAP